MRMWKIIFGEYSTFGDVVIMRMWKIIFGEYSAYVDVVIMRMWKWKIILALMGMWWL
jgi:hypothetical protein